MASRKSTKRVRPAKAKIQFATAAGFRRVALSLPEAVEGSHMGHADFRVGGKIFATLGCPDAQWGVVKLTPTQQAKLMRDQPAVFVPAKGAWGRSGSTQVRLENIDEPTLRRALLAAWRNTAPSHLIAKFDH